VVATGGVAVGCAQAARIRARIVIKINILDFFIVSPIRKSLSFLNSTISKMSFLGLG
jgi:hypothetical protein